MTSKNIRANYGGHLTIGLMEDIESSQIKLSKQPLRSDLRDVGPLAESIGEIGLLHPLVVRIIDDGDFEIVAGNRRFLACRHLSLRKIPCHIVDLADKEAYEISLIENTQRERMNPIEEGQAFIRYIVDYGWGGESELAKVIGKSQEYVSKRIKLLDLPEETQNEIIRRRIKPSIGEELAYIKDKDTQSRLAKMVSERHVTVKQLRDKIAAAAPADEQQLNIDKTNNSDTFYFHTRSIKTYDKAIIALKLSLKRMNNILESIEDDADWFVNSSLLQQRAIISSQIDTLQKEKKKYSKLAGRLGGHFV